MTEWAFAALGLVGFVALVRQTLIRRLGWRARRSSWSALLVLPVLVCAWTMLSLATMSGTLDGAGLALLVIPIFLIGSFLIGAVGVGFSMLFDSSPESEL